MSAVPRPTAAQPVTARPPWLPSSLVSCEATATLAASRGRAAGVALLRRRRGEHQLDIGIGTHRHRAALHDGRRAQLDFMLSGSERQARHAVAQETRRLPIDENSPAAMPCARTSTVPLRPRSSSLPSASSTRRFSASSPGAVRFSLYVNCVRDEGRPRDPEMDSALTERAPRGSSTLPQM